MVTLIVGIASPLASVVAAIITIRTKQKQILILCLRSVIQGIHSTYRDKKALPAEVYRGMCEMYDQYHDPKGLNQNSYISALKAEMDKWEKE